MKSCLKQISNIYSNLSYSEKLFADYVLQNRDKVVYMPIAELSEILGIASSTIIAATKKLGFSGFRELKISLASELLNPAENWTPAENNGESSKSDIYSRVLNSNISALQESLQNLTCDQLLKAAAWLLEAPHIYLFGIGTSNILAREAYDFFFRLGLTCTHYEDWHYQLLTTSRLGPGDTALLISQSGVNKDIINLAERLKERGCRTIGISNYMGTPFSKYTDILLAPLTMLSQTHDNHFSFRVPILCIIETLYYMLSDQMGERYLSALDQNHNLVRQTSIIQ